MLLLKLKKVLDKAEENLLSMVNLMLDKRRTDISDSVAIDTTEISVRVMKAKGGNLPLEYSGKDGGFALPYYETFQNRQKKKNVSINVRLSVNCKISAIQLCYMYVTIVDRDVISVHIMKLNRACT